MISQDHGKSTMVFFIWKIKVLKGGYFMIRTLLFVLFVGVIVIGIIMLIVANKDAMIVVHWKSWTII